MSDTKQAQGKKFIFLEDLTPLQVICRVRGCSVPEGQKILGRIENSDTLVECYKNAVQAQRTPKFEAARQAFFNAMKSKDEIKAEEAAKAKANQSPPAS